MITFIKIVTLLISIGNVSEQPPTIDINKIEYGTEVLNIADHPYNLQLRIETTANNTHNLIISIKLKKGSSYISPFETKAFTGKFYMDLGSYKDLSLDKNIVESPQAVARYDGFVDGPVIWVEENTTYKQ